MARPSLSCPAVLGNSHPSATRLTESGDIQDYRMNLERPLFRPGNSRDPATAAPRGSGPYSLGAQSATIFRQTARRPARILNRTGGALGRPPCGDEGAERGRSE